jgi:thiol:disulfide interchange protein DsbA
MAGVSFCRPGDTVKLRIARVFALLALLPAAAFASADAPVEGEDYQTIADGQPFAPLDGKVEVVEVFSYACIHCAHFQPALAEWAKKQPAYVRFTPVPATLRQDWLPFARAYYAALNLGVAARSHDAVFKALHESGSLPLQNPSAGEIAAFYAQYGVKPQTFAYEFDGARVDAQVRRATDFAVREQVDGTPTLIVDGKYRVLGRSYGDALRIVDALVRRERAAK